ncbi:MAG: histidine kinase [Cyclobacteriaceae bacterium]
MSYSKLPFPPFIIALGLLFLMLVVWVQGGFNATSNHLVFLASSYLVWGILLPFIQGLVSNYKSGRQYIVQLILTALLLISVHFIISNIIYYGARMLVLRNYSLLTTSEFMRIIGPSFVARGVDFILFFGILSWVRQTKKVNEKEMKIAKMQSNLNEARVKSLKSQLNPHFLFNTLHTVSSLIGRDDNKARDITIKISALLRKVLLANDQEQYPLSEELELVNDYLAIEQERFKDRLTIKMDVDESLTEVMVPSFILQPLIENSFKHGVSLVEGKTTLQIAIKRNSATEELMIEVINDIPKQSNNQQIKSSTGIGLTNLRDRLNAYYGNKTHIEYASTKDHKFEVKVIVPLVL